MGKIAPFFIVLSKNSSQRFTTQKMKLNTETEQFNNIKNQKCIIIYKYNLSLVTLKKNNIILKTTDLKFKETVAFVHVQQMKK